MANDILTVNGIALPTPSEDGLTITHRPVVADGAGRDQSGRMAVKMVARKWTIDVEYKNIYEPEVQRIYQLIYPTFNLTVKYPNPHTGTIQSSQMYVGDTAVTWKWLGPEKIYRVASTLSFTFIEM